MVSVIRLFAAFLIAPMVPAFMALGYNVMSDDVVIYEFILGMGAMVLWHINAFSLPFPHVWSTVGTSLIATAFTLRAVGEFKYVGFFKRIRGTQFARMDTRFYSPLCLGVAAGLWVLALA